jgi:hypothetical protein
VINFDSKNLNEMETKSYHFKIAVDELNLGFGEFCLGDELINVEDTRASVVKQHGQLGVKGGRILVPVFEHAADSVAETSRETSSFGAEAHRAVYAHI